MEALESSEALEITYQLTLCANAEDHTQNSAVRNIKYAVHNVT